MLKYCDFKHLKLKNQRFISDFLHHLGHGRTVWKSVTFSKANLQNCNNFWVDDYELQVFSWPGSSTTTHFIIWTQRVIFVILYPSNIRSEWCLKVTASWKKYEEEKIGAKMKTKLRKHKLKFDSDPDNPDSHDHPDQPDQACHPDHPECPKVWCQGSSALLQCFFLWNA